MESFTERMLERTQKRQQLLASVAVETTAPTTAKTLEQIKPAEPVESVGTIDPSVPPLQQKRRTRLAELASRVDQWLVEDLDVKPNENVSSKTEIKTRVKVSGNDSILKQQPEKLEPQPKSSRVQQLRQKKQLPDNKTPPQWQSPNLSAATLTVAQRRALFEQNVAAQQNQKPTTTTVVKISLAKTSPVLSSKAKTTLVEEENNVPVANTVITTPPRPIPCVSTPPSRRGTRPRISPAIAALGLSESSPPRRQAWTPPCIKNVLLKKQLTKELDNEEQTLSENNIKSTTVATSSPIDSSTVSPADRIAKSVGRVRFVSPSPSSSLYPDLSLIEDSNDNNDKETEIMSIDNQFTGCKRRSNGNNASSSSMASSESLNEDDDNNEILCAKRSRCELEVEHFEASSSTVKQDSISADSSTPVLSMTAATYGCNNSSVLSNHLNASPLSLPSDSFTYYPSSDHPMLGDVDLSLTKASINSPSNKNGHTVELRQSDKCLKPSDEQSLVVNTPHRSIREEPELVHTVSIYRKQQQKLRSGGTPLSKLLLDPGSALFEQQRLMQRNHDNDYLDDDDDEDYKLQELETAAARAWHLEQTVVPAQDRIIDQATHALNTCDMYRQRSGLRSESSSKFSDEHVHAERLLLIAGLRRIDAVREAQRLRVEHTLLPDGVLGKKNGHLKVNGNGKTLVIESLRVPILSSSNTNSHNKTKYSAIEGMENQTRWPGGYRYFVCAVRAAATACRPPITAGTRPADALAESVRRFSVDTHDDGISYGYVEFITKRQIKNSNSRKQGIPSEAEGGPIMIHGLDDDGWKVTVELYGLSPTATGNLESHSGKDGKEHDTHENKSVLDKLWSTVKTPIKESKKHGATGSTCIESPGGSTAVRNTVFRQLGYFVFSNGQVDRQQFTLNKVHQSGSHTSSSRGAGEETVRVRMRLLEEGEPYSYNYDEGMNGNIIKGCSAKKLLSMPSECKQAEGFLTLFDDNELRSTPTIDRGQQWQRHSDISSGPTGGTTLWRRLWFRAEIIDDSLPQKLGKNSDNETLVNHQQYNLRQRKTIVLRYWMYPEHAEQQREPLGTINLGRCVPPEIETSRLKQTPAAPAPPDLCARPNTLRLILYNSDANYDDDHQAIMNGIDDPLLLAADTADERREWCETVNAAVTAISEHRKWFKLAEASFSKQEQRAKENEQKVYQHHEQQSSPWSTTLNSKSISKKKKLYK